ncbi:MAG TPA: ATP-binding protein [Acidimicrobiia bacterium]|jgi:anti-sigma regulatory factor (Ser/Thr protein kinase)
MTDASRSFLNRPASIGAARRFVADLVDGIAPEMTETVVLMLSELATNCVRYEHSDFEVHVDAHADHIRVEVHDQGHGQPIMRSPEPYEASGRGLQIVNAFARSWGVSETPGVAGKTVWFEVSPNAVV